MSKDVLYKEWGVGRICRALVVLGREAFLAECTQARSPILVHLDEPRCIDTTKSLYRRGPQGGVK